MLHRFDVTLDRNSQRLLDLCELLNKAAEDVHKLYSDHRSTYTQMFIAEDVVMDLHSGILSIYYKDND